MCDMDVREDGRKWRLEGRRVKMAIDSCPRGTLILQTLLSVIRKQMCRAMSANMLKRHDKLNKNNLIFKMDVFIFCSI